MVLLFSGGTVGLILLLAKLFADRIDTERILLFLDSIPIIGYCIAGIVFCLLILIVSIAVSIRILEKKAF